MGFLFVPWSISRFLHGAYWCLKYLEQLSVLCRVKIFMITTRSYWILISTTGTPQKPISFHFFPKRLLPISFDGSQDVSWIVHLCYYFPARALGRKNNPWNRYMNIPARTQVCSIKGSEEVSITYFWALYAVFFDVSIVPKQSKEVIFLHMKKMSGQNSLQLIIDVFHTLTST